MVGQREVEERSRGHDGELRRLLVQPPKLRQYLGCALDLVEEQQRSAVEERRSRERLDRANHARGIAIGEQAGGPGVALEVQLDEIEAASPGEVTNQVRLAHLTGAADDERLPAAAGKPGDELVGCCPFHPAI